MGTFTISYAFKKIIVDRKFTLLGAAVGLYFADCYDRASYHKVEMMKCQSKMFSNIPASLPKHVDPWKY
uniref:COX6C domain-containing protein n=1 Tax=Strongyloides stercoralis TaxID=6248 RepID=A0A0K0EIL4_STRER